MRSSQLTNSSPSLKSGSITQRNEKFRHFGRFPRRLALSLHVRNGEYPGIGHVECLLPSGNPDVVIEGFGGQVVPMLIVPSRSVTDLVRTEILRQRVHT